MKKSHILIPTPNSRFIEIICKECESKNIIFSHSTSLVNCNSCGNIITKPTGSIAQINGKIVKIVDFESKKSILKMKKMTPQSQITLSQKNVFHCLLDTMIIHSILNDEEDVLKHIQIHTQNKNVEFVILDRILKETKNMEKTEYNENFTNEQILKKINRFGKIKQEVVDWNSDEGHAALEIHDSKKYVDKNGEPLSESDCFLMVWAQKNSWEIITRDNLLRTASKENNVKIFSPNWEEFN